MGAEGTSERRLKLRAQAGTSDSYSQSALPCGIASQSHDRVSHPGTQPSFLSGTGGSVRNKAQFLLSRSLQSSGIALHRDSWGGKGPFRCYALTGVPAALPSGAVGWPAYDGGHLVQGTCPPFPKRGTALFRLILVPGTLFSEQRRLPLLLSTHREAAAKRYQNGREQTELSLLTTACPGTGG